MELTITGRNFEISDEIRDYAKKKLLRVEKFFQQLIDMHLILFIERQNHIAEVIVNGDGVQFYAKEEAGDMYSAIDILSDTIEKQIVKYKEKHSGHKVIPFSEANFVDTIKVNDEDVSIKVKNISNKPIDEVEAYLQMKMDGKDFILYKKGVKSLESIDYMNKLYAVLFKQNDELFLYEMNNINSNDENGKIASYKIVVKNQDSVTPEIEKQADNSTSIEQLVVSDAINLLNKGNKNFLTFVNSETNMFNVLVKNGNMYELYVPAYY